MSRFGDEIRRTIGERESKELYPGYVDALGSSESLELSTFVTKLSKLLNGNADRERYFLEKPSRSSALEKTLGVAPGWLAAQQQVRVLVLDPELPENASAYLKEREVRAAGAFACRQVSLEGLPPPVARTAVLARIRGVADQESCALVIAKDRKDDLYFAGANLVWTTLEGHRRGFVLVSDPALVPLPEPLPPPLFDEQGEPLMPHAAFETFARGEIVRARVGYSWSANHDYTTHDRAIREADAAGRSVSLPVWAVLAWALPNAELSLCTVDHAYDRSVSSPLRIDRSQLAVQVFHAVESADRTVLWSYARRILGVGPLVEQIAGMLAPHHEIVQPATLLRWQEALEAWNPWRSGGNGGLGGSERWKSLAVDVLRELAVSIDSATNEWRQRVAKRCARFDTPARLATPTEEQSAQEALATLAARLWRDWSWPLRLDAASRARVAILPGHGEREELHVVANLGAGQLLRIQVVRFPGEKQEEFVPCGGALEMDGGDVHIWCQALSDRFLEGSALPAREHRRREAEDAERSRREADDADD